MSKKFDFDQEINRWDYYERKYDERFIREQKAMNCQKHDVINAGIADIDFKTAPPVLDAIVERAKKGTYSYSFESVDTLNAIAKWYKKTKNLNVLPYTIKLTGGTTTVLFQSVIAFTKPGESVLIQTPVYAPFGKAVRNNGRTLITNELEYDFTARRYQINFEDFEEKIRDNKVKLFLMCSPHNPGEVIWTKAELEKIVQICKKYDVVIVSDEVHSDIVYDEFTSILAFDYENIILASSPNKTFNMGGIGGSYVIIPDCTLFERFANSYGATLLDWPNVFINAAYQAAYDNEESYEWAMELKDYIWNNYQMVEKELKDTKYHICKMQAMYLAWINFKAIKNADRFWELAKKEKIIFSCHQEFEGEDEYWFRLNVAMPKAKLKKVLEMIKKLEVCA